MSHTAWMHRPREQALHDQQLVYLAVREKPGSRSNELAALTGLSHRRVIRALPALEGDGVIERNGRNWYPTSS